jgi:hypothetical protein
METTLGSKYDGKEKEERTAVTKYLRSVNIFV